MGERSSGFCGRKALKVYKEKQIRFEVRILWELAGNPLSG